MIKFDNVTKTYNNSIKAVQNLNLEIKEGEIFGFLGPNGAGKTTTIKMLTGIIPSDSGSITLNGIDIVEDPTKAKREFGFVPDSPDIFLRLKGIEYLNFMADIYNVDSEKRVNRIQKLSQKFQMENSLLNQIKSYSHGMRQKIVLIGALIHEPEILILDEPLSGLDPKSAFLLKEMMRDYAKAGKTVLFSTHVLDVAEKICDRVGVINKGIIQFSGTIADMKSHFNSNKSLEKMFLEMTIDE